MASPVEPCLGLHWKQGPLDCQQQVFLSPQVGYVNRDRWGPRDFYSPPVARARQPLPQEVAGWVLFQCSGNDAPLRMASPAEPYAGITDLLSAIADYLELCDLQNSAIDSGKRATLTKTKSERRH